MKHPKTMCRGKGKTCTSAYWEKALRSLQQKMSRGAQEVDRIITSAHKDNWRRKEKKK